MGFNGSFPGDAPHDARSELSQQPVVWPLPAQSEPYQLFAAQERPTERSRTRRASALPPWTTRKRRDLDRRRGEPFMRPDRLGAESLSWRMMARSRSSQRREIPSISGGRQRLTRSGSRRTFAILSVPFVVAPGVGATALGAVVSPSVLGLPRFLFQLSACLSDASLFAHPLYQLFAPGTL